MMLGVLIVMVTVGFCFEKIEFFVYTSFEFI